MPYAANIPETSVFYNLEVSARRFPEKTAIQFFGTATSYARQLGDVDRMAGYLQQGCGVKRGDRVIVFSQNCPQFIAAYFAVLLVPVNAMLREDEMRHIAQDSGAVVAFVGEELLLQVVPLLADTPLRHVIVHTYGARRRRRRAFHPVLGAPAFVRASAAARRGALASGARSRAAAWPASRRPRRSLHAALHLGHRRRLACTRTAW